MMYSPSIHETKDFFGFTYSIFHNFILQILFSTDINESRIMLFMKIRCTNILMYQYMLPISIMFIYKGGFAPLLLHTFVKEHKFKNVNSTLILPPAHMCKLPPTHTFKSPPAHMFKSHPPTCLNHHPPHV